MAYHPASAGMTSGDMSGGHGGAASYGGAAPGGLSGGGAGVGDLGGGYGGLGGHLGGMGMPMGGPGGLPVLSGVGVPGSSVSAAHSGASAPVFSGSGPGGSGGATASKDGGADSAALGSIYPLVHQLTRPELREGALLELSKKREEYPDLAPVLWHSFGTISALLQEIVGIYPFLSPPALTAHASNRVCNALALLQCVASHAETRSLFLSAHIPLFLYPFLNTVSKNRPFEYLRLTSLGVIGALVKMDDSEVVNFLLQTEIIPLCLRIMETGSELSKTVATFIVQKILLDDTGLNYICHTAERFYAVSTVLSNMVSMLVEHPSHRLLKHIVRCYLRLADNPRAREALRTCLPTELRDNTFALMLQGDPNTKRWLAQLSMALTMPTEAGATGANLAGAGGP
uniref:Cell differentiation protein rcd1 n=1 Tax=Bicosoecida sp. CB-2014 TaxID=1486930 RepID=A0A7S1CCS5_9STRA|mmetsp:Transcript_19361/g.68513  ORF Transcript_19361/g.68513 Transcript_19361/m.68513 type:complete len:400 (+) Transcript_19361:222-1421(+)